MSDTTERDNFLIKVMGECGKCLDACPVSCTDFSTWEWFGKLWEWAQKQEWFGTFCKTHSNCIDKDNMHLLCLYIDPNRFADAVYLFLKEREQ